MLTLLRNEPRPRYASDLAAASHRLKLRLPDALVEAYAGAGYYLDNPSSFRLHHKDGTPMLAFRYESQSVFYWAIALDGSPDPPVFARMSEPKDAQWISACVNLSTFIYAVVFDSQHWDVHTSREYGKDDWGRTKMGETFGRLSVADIKFLRETFDEHPQTYGLPAPVTYRFWDGWAKRITIDDYDGRGFYATVQSDWAVSAATEADFTDLKAKLSVRWSLPDG